MYIALTWRLAQLLELGPFLVKFHQSKRGQHQDGNAHRSDVNFNCKMAQIRRLQLAAIQLWERLRQVCFAKRYCHLTCSNYNKSKLMSMHTLEIIIVFLFPEQFSSMELGHFVIQWFIWYTTPKYLHWFRGILGWCPNKKFRVRPGAKTIKKNTNSTQNKS